MQIIVKTGGVMHVALMGHLSSSIKAGHAALKEAASWVWIFPLRVAEG